MAFDGYNRGVSSLLVTNTLQPLKEGVATLQLTPNKPEVSLQHPCYIHRQRLEEVGKAQLQTVIYTE